MENINFFLDALARYTYLQNAMGAGILVGIICGLIGCFIILRGMALMGDAISHAVLPGVAIAYFLGFSFFIGAVITGVLTALGIGYISQNSKIKDDSAIGIMFTASFALGIVMITARRGTGVDLWHILFGNVLAVSQADLLMTLSIGVLVITCVLLFYKQLVLSTFDPTMAQAVGLPTKLIHYALMLILSLVTVASLQTVGIVLVVAMLITPGATAYLLTNRLPIMLLLSMFFGVFSAVTGVYFSFIYDVATGASIVLVASILFGLSFLFSPKQGLFFQKYRAYMARANNKLLKGV
ncbi:iron/zinc/copper transport system permease protein [Desulfitispora alkaliphila]|uniref:metal ABC transporter permease n=1 Tax=Desulfitispora alkaliphila TaxID=622674 RepID=UPI003D231DB6